MPDKSYRWIPLALACTFLVSMSMVPWREDASGPMPPAPVLPTVIETPPLPVPMEPPPVPMEPPPVPMEPPPDEGAPLLFGLDAGSLAAQQRVGIEMDYGTIWIGAWTLKSGWGGPDNQLAAMKAEGVTPAIHFYYWGDDISQDCLQEGCWSSLHGVHKSTEQWVALTDELVAHLHAVLDGAPVLVILETEFNKNDVNGYEPLDEALAQRITEIQQGYPAATVALGLGTWNLDAWTIWDAAATASDAIGLQAVHAVEVGEDYAAFAQRLVEAAAFVNATFKRPIVISDIAFSTYRGAEVVQADGIHALFDHMEALTEHGVTALIYRSWTDSLAMDTSNAFGEAERYWGLARDDGGSKPGGQAWLQGVVAARGGPLLEASFNVTDGINEWWVEVAVDGNIGIQGVQAIVDGTPRSLSSTAWGTWAASFYVGQDTPVQFVATDYLGRSSQSTTWAWPG